MQIQTYTKENAKALTDLFYEAVHAIDSSIYTQKQKSAWAPLPPDYAFWEKRLAKKKPYLAMLDHKVIGFIELESDGHIDCMYTHPNYQYQGVASALYDYVFEKAKLLGVSRLYVEASYLAKPFFSKKGFFIVKENQVQLNGQVLINYEMQRSL